MCACGHDGKSKQLCYTLQVVSQRTPESCSMSLVFKLVCKIGIASSNVIVWWHGWFGLLARSSY